jgi:hypothetical protein
MGLWLRARGYLAKNDHVYGKGVKDGEVEIKYRFGGNL